MELYDSMMVYLRAIVTIMGLTWFDFNETSKLNLIFWTQKGAPLSPQILFPFSFLNPDQ